MLRALFAAFIFALTVTWTLATPATAARGGTNFDFHGDAFFPDAIPPSSSYSSTHSSASSSSSANSSLGVSVNDMQPSFWSMRECPTTETTRLYLDLDSADPALILFDT